MLKECTGGYGEECAEFASALGVSGFDGVDDVIGDRASDEPLGIGDWGKLREPAAGIVIEGLRIAGDNCGKEPIQTGLAAVGKNGRLQDESNGGKTNVRVVDVADGPKLGHAIVLESGVDGSARDACSAKFADPGLQGTVLVEKIVCAGDRVGGEEQNERDANRR